MTQADIWRIAKIQSAIDAHCAPEDFDRAENVIVHSAADPRARRYLELPFACDLISYGPNLVASVSPQLEAAVRQYASRYAPAHCFETPNLHVLEASLRPTDIPPASWPNTFCRCWTRWPPYAAGMNFGYWVLRILRRCIPRNGPTLCVKRGAALTCSASALLTAGGLSGWPALRPTARRCGRSGLTCCRVTGARVSRLR